LLTFALHLSPFPYSKNGEANLNSEINIVYRTVS
jgi:hypothetical protein